jgi:hypothetical protein
MAVRVQQVAEQLDVEGVVLDNQYSGQTLLPPNLDPDANRRC